MGSSCGLLTPRNKEKELKEGHTTCFYVTYHTTFCRSQKTHFILEEEPALQLLLPGGEVQGALVQSSLSGRTTPAKAIPAFYPQRDFHRNHAFSSLV